MQRPPRKVKTQEGPLLHPQNPLNLPLPKPRSKEGWDDVYSELNKLEFEYDKAALESLGKKESFKKAIRHQMKVFLLIFISFIFSINVRRY